MKIRSKRRSKSRKSSTTPKLVVRLKCWRNEVARLTLDLGGKKVATKEKRWYKDVGLGFKTPSEAINGTYIGASCDYSHLIYILNFAQTRSALSPVTSPSVAVSSPAVSSPRK